MDCYIINLERDKDRWTAASERFGQLGFNVIRVPAVDGKTLTNDGLISPAQIPGFAAWRYFFFYGRPVTLGEIGCYFSHIKTLKTFLDTNAEHALICEDDVVPKPELPEVLTAALKYSDRWDLLRLNAVRQTKGKNVIELPHQYHLCCDLKTASGNGAKIVNRFAAQQIVKKLLPMCLPHDVALFYDFPLGIKEMTVQPYPVVLNESFYKDTTITGRKERYPFFSPTVLRYLTVLPYKFISRTVRKIERIKRAVSFRK
jgi:glycosyl transferase family 25